MLHNTKIALIVAVALWGLIGSFHNFSDWGETLGAVAAVASMVTFEGGADKWQATSQPVVIWTGAIFIAISKLVTAALCFVGGFRMWQAKGLTPSDFNQAKELALAGCAVAVIMLFGGFLVIAESWYELWRSDVMRAPVLEAAFRYAGMILLIAIFVAIKDE